VTLRDLMARHARTVLVRADHHGEEVTYTFRAGGSWIGQAVVDRLDLEPLEGAPQVSVLMANVAIPRDVDGVEGIPAVTPGDYVTCVLELGKAAARARVRWVVAQDEAMFLVRVEA
jgi:hypothetical protein